MEEKVLIKSYIAKKTKNIILGCMGAFWGIAIFLPPPFFIITCLSAILGIVTSIIFLAIMNCELTITEKNVKGRALFGKEVVLPLYMISAFSTQKLFATIAVATSSGITKFSLIGNYKEIGQVISQLINERQRDTVTTKASDSAPQNSSMDELVKLKALLDQGIITQEEFDAKKKQLLEL